MKRCVFLALTLVAACGSSGHLAPPKRASVYGSTAKGFTGHGPKVAIIGDSLTVEDWDDLYNTLDSQYAVAIGAYIGEGYAGGALSSLGTKRGGLPVVMRIARRYASFHPAVVVFAIGTNDAWHAQPISRALANMRVMVSEMRPACLVGVTLAAHNGAVGWSSEVANQLNAATRSWADQLVDWASMSQKPGVLLDDRVHTTPAGTVLRSAAIARAVRNCKPRSGSN